MSRKNKPNKPKINPYDIAEKFGCDPFTILIHFCKGDWEALGYDSPTETKYSAKGDAFETDRITPELRLGAAKDAVKYLYSQHKSVDHSSSDGTALLAPLILRSPDPSTEPKTG